MVVEAMGNFSMNTVLEWRRKNPKFNLNLFKAYWLLYEQTCLKLKKFHIAITLHLYVL